MNWWRAVGVDVDDLINAAAGGDADETVSMHVAEEAAKGRPWAVGAQAGIDAIVGARHCEDTLAGKPTPRSQAWRAAAAFAAPFLALVAGLVWLIRSI